MVAASRTPSGREAAGPGRWSAPARTPLVMLAGTLCDRRLFEPLLDRLDRRGVLAPDMTGPTTTRALAERVLEAAPSRFALLGFSLGGIVGLEVTARAGGRLAGLALVNTTARPVDEDAKAARRAAAQDACRRGLQAWTVDDLLPRSAGAAARGDPVLADVLGRMAAAAGAQAMVAQTEVALGRADSRPRLSAISVPTLVVGGVEDRTCTPEMHEELAAGVAGSRLAILPGVGHFAPLEAPDRLARLVQAWLDDVDLAACSAGPPVLG